MKWKNTTAYSMGQRDKVTPRTWSAKHGGLCIVVTRHVYFADDVWVLTVQPGLPGISNTHALESAAIKDAQLEALEMIRQTVTKMAAFWNSTD